MFGWFFKKKKENEENKAENLKPLAKRSLETIVVDKCEQMLELSSEKEEEENEYRRVTNYLNDIQIIEELNENEYSAIVETAANIEAVNSSVDAYLKAEKKISESQFRQMQELEDEIPNAIRRLKENEEYLDKIKRDMNYLEGEKIEWTYLKEDANDNIEKLKRLSVFAFAIIASIVVLLFVIQQVLLVDIQLAMFLLLFLVTVYFVFFLVKLQDEQKTVKKANAYINRAISLENHVKIKYVNIKNAVDYSQEKYHVTNSKEFEYVWECYNEAVREHAKYQKNSTDLTYFQEKYIRQLKRYHLYDTSIWMKYTRALVDKREMVEIKHDLLLRRQKLREQIEYHATSIQTLKEEVEKDFPKMRAGGDKVKEILRHFA